MGACALHRLNVGDGDRHDVRASGLEQRDPRGLLGHRDHADVLDGRRPRLLPVVAVAAQEGRQLHRLLALRADELVGTGADRERAGLLRAHLVEVLVRHNDSAHRAVRAREPHRHARHGLLGLDQQRVALGGDRVDESRHGRERVLGLRAEHQPVVAERQVVGGEVVAVVELDAVPDIEAPGQLVGRGLPRGSQARNVVAAEVLHDRVVEDLVPPGLVGLDEDGEIVLAESLEGDRRDNRLAGGTTRRAGPGRSAGRRGA